MGCRAFALQDKGSHEPVLRSLLAAAQAGALDSRRDARDGPLAQAARRKVEGEVAYGLGQVGILQAPGAAARAQRKP